MPMINPEDLAKFGSEDTHSKALMCWCGYNLKLYPMLRWLTHIPNGGARDLREGAKFKLMGVKRGFPDYALMVTNKYAGLFIELKIEKRRKEKNGGCSEEQIEWIDYLQQAGYYVKVCYGWEEARDTLIKYLEGKL